MRLAMDALLEFKLDFESFEVESISWLLNSGFATESSGIGTSGSVWVGIEIDSVIMELTEESEVGVTLCSASEETSEAEMLEEVLESTFPGALFMTCASGTGGVRMPDPSLVPSLASIGGVAGSCVSAIGGEGTGEEEGSGEGEEEGEGLVIVSLVRLRRCESVSCCGGSAAGELMSLSSRLLLVSVVSPPSFFDPSPSTAFRRFLRCESGDGVLG